MRRLTSIICLLIFFLNVSEPSAQSSESTLRIFGYFQNSLQHWTTFEDRQKQNSFSLQQLNLFFQRDLSRKWTALINFEFLNNFSSIRQWGTANLEEAWVRYRLNEKFSLKLGLQIPIFNNLNEINNRTPLLPYIIRPLVYETSFGEFLPIEEFVPARAFAQVYGFFPSGKAKFDYAVYIGNSANINDDRERGQTGVDTTTNFLVGGRLGIRYEELKLGISATYEKRNEFEGIAKDIGRSPSELQGLPATRLGGDLSYNFANFSFESEFITGKIDAGIPELELDIDFYYVTLGYHFTEELFIYGSYWVTKSHFKQLIPGNESEEDEEIFSPNIGASYNLNDRIRLKAQFARVKSNDFLISQDTLIKELVKEEDNFTVFALAVSVVY